MSMKVDGGVGQWGSEWVMSEINVSGVISPLVSSPQSFEWGG
jgi:hypothetical protein